MNPAKDVYRIDRDARRFHVDEQEADPLLALAGVVRAHKAEHPVGDVCARGPDLGSADDVLITLPDGARLQRGKVGSGAGLRISLAPDHAFLADQGQETVLLGVRPPGVKNRRQHTGAERGQLGAFGDGRFLVPDVLLRR